MECLGVEPGGGMMEGADESTELWRVFKPITLHLQTVRIRFPYDFFAPLT